MARARTYPELMAEAKAEFQALERREAAARNSKQRPVESLLPVLDVGICPCCGHPAVLRGMCRRSYMRWHHKKRRAKRAETQQKSATETRPAPG